MRSKRATTLHNFEFKAMGSPCAVRMYADSQEKAHAVFALAKQEIDRLEQKYSRFLENNFMAQLNQAASQGSEHAIDEETFSLFQYADQCFQQSDGLFDITSGVLRKLWRFKDQAALPQQSEIDQVLESVGWQYIKFDDQRIKFTKPNMELDFGGVVKEYAADRLMAVCRQQGVESGVVDLGGDIAVIGPHPNGEPWKINIRHPRENNQHLACFELYQGGLASSGDYERYIEINGQRYAHILSPKTGWPVKGLAAVSVHAERCVLAGSLATIAMLKETAGEPWLKSLQLDYVSMSADEL